MHIAFCTDTNYVMPCGVAMTSICENNKEEEITFHLVITDEGTAPDEVEKKVAPLRDIVVKYEKLVEVYRMDAEKIKAFTCSGAGYVSATGFSRIFLPEILSNSINKVLYLDCDLVCDGSLRDLWNYELNQDCPIGAVVDCNYASVSNHLNAKIPQSVNYINSGVLLMNLDCWRKNNYIELAVNNALENKYPLLDQDMLNNIFCGKIHYLPTKYNLQLVTLLRGIDNCHITLEYYDELKETCKSPIIIHYVSAQKPWKSEYCPFREVWEKYLYMTIWKNVNYSPVASWFEWSYIYKEFQDTYWMDASLFKEGLKPYLRFFRALVRLKSKHKFVRMSSFFLNQFASLLEKVYVWKTRK